MDLSTASAIFSGISTAFKFADFALRLAEVGSENEVFVRTIQVVRTDLHEVERLLQVKVVQQKLIGVPAKFSWIQNAVTSTKKALHEIGKWVERARVDQEAIGSVKFENRVRWVFNDREKLVNGKTELLICHQQLSNVLNFLVPLEEIPVTSEPPTYQDVARFEDLLSPHALRQAKSCMSMSQRRVSDEYSASSTRTKQHRNPEPKTSSATYADSDYSMRSPPPTYVSAFSSTNAFPGTTESSSLGRTHWETKPAYKPTEESCDIKKQTWAYMHDGFQEPNNYIPELEDTHVEMSATNTTGPVSPFELLPDQVTPRSRPSYKASGPFELPGDTTLPTELDAGFLGNRPSQRSAEPIKNSLPVFQTQRSAEPIKNSLPVFQTPRSAEPIKNSLPVFQFQHHKSADNTGPWEMPSPCAGYIPKQTASQGHYTTSPPLPSRPYTPIPPLPPRPHMTSPPLPPRPRTTSQPVNSAPKTQTCTHLSIMNMLNALDDD